MSAVFARGRQLVRLPAYKVTSYISHNTFTAALFGFPSLQADPCIMFVDASIRQNFSNQVSLPSEIRLRLRKR